MNTLIVKRLNADVTEAQEVVSLLDASSVAYESIAEVNWAKDFPYAPNVHFRIAYTDSSLLLHYRVAEDTVRAVTSEDNGRVWEDSCVEFFSAPVGNTGYYNMEFNCIGSALVRYGKDRHERKSAPQDILHQIKRWSSLGSVPFQEKTSQCSWEVALIIPFSAFFLHEVRPYSGLRMRANFYKCGDLTAKPHFLSWNKIAVDKPDFHRPEFFGELIFD